jgi:hypothetical protein
MKDASTNLNVRIVRFSVFNWGEGTSGMTYAVVQPMQFVLSARFVGEFREADGI